MRPASASEPERWLTLGVRILQHIDLQRPSTWGSQVDGSKGQVKRNQKSIETGEIPSFPPFGVWDLVKLSTPWLGRRPWWWAWLRGCWWCYQFWLLIMTVAITSSKSEVSCRQFHQVRRRTMHKLSISPLSPLIRNMFSTHNHYTHLELYLQFGKLASVRNLKWHAKRLRHPVQWKRWSPRLGPIDILKVCQVGLPNMHELRISPPWVLQRKNSFTLSCFLFPTCLRPCFFSQRNSKQNSRHPNASMWWLKMILNLMVLSPYKMSLKMDDLVGSTMKTWATWSLTRR